MFYTITNLQGSQTIVPCSNGFFSFTPLQTYKVLKLFFRKPKAKKVLHHYKLTRFSNGTCKDVFEDRFYTITNLQGSQTFRQKRRDKMSFTPLQTYKVLKPNSIITVQTKVLHHYKLTRFSNRNWRHYWILQVLHHYKLTRFSNHAKRERNHLCCFTPLQTYKVLKPQIRSSPNRTYRSICVSHLVMYKTHVFIY